MSFTTLKIVSARVSQSEEWLSRALLVGNLEKKNLVMKNCAAERCSTQPPMHLLHPHPPPILLCRRQMVQVGPKLFPKGALILTVPSHPRSSRVFSTGQCGTARPQTHLPDIACCLTPSWSSFVSRLRRILRFMLKIRCGRRISQPLLTSCNWCLRRRLLPPKTPEKTLGRAQSWPMPR